MSLGKTTVLDAAFAHLRDTAAIRHIVVFGAVGGIAFVVDVGLFTVLRASFLADHAVAAKVVSVAVATVVAWVGHRMLTFRSTAGATGLLRELGLFSLVNVGGLLLAAAVLFISHDILGFTSVVADNVAGNVIGLVLATAFRYFAYRLVVFRHPGEVVPHVPVLDPRATLP